MTQLFRYVNRKQLARGQLRAVQETPRGQISMEISNRSDADRLHINSVDSDHEEFIANEDSTDQFVD